MPLSSLFPFTKLNHPTTGYLDGIGAGLLLSKARNQSLWEGVLGIVAAFMVASLTVHMWRAGRHMKKDIEGKDLGVRLRKTLDHEIEVLEHSSDARKFRIKVRYSAPNSALYSPIPTR